MSNIDIASIVVLLVGIAILYVVHKLGAGLLQRLGGLHPFFTRFAYKAYMPSRWLLWLLWLRLWFGSLDIHAHWVSTVALSLNTLLVILLTVTCMVIVDAIADVVVASHPLDQSENLKARRIYTQTRVLARSAHFILALIGFAFVLMMLPGAKQIGASLLASAGVAGLVAGMAARPVVGNFIAGLQLAFTQPIRIDDVVIIEGEWGRIEEITATFVVVKVWDERRLIVPLQWFVENVFQNWTHHSASILGTTFLWLDYGADLEPIKKAFEQLCRGSALWDGRVCLMQVVESDQRGMQLRFLMSAEDSGILFDLRCLVREGLIQYIHTHQPHAFVRLRTAEQKATPS